jgi:hypothetical protein
VCDVASFSLYALDIVLRVFDGYGVLVADGGDLGGYVNYSDDACRARKTVRDAIPGAAAE